jgi:putative pyridoxal-dependent aspartate 1-decarboxylase
VLSLKKVAIANDTFLRKLFTTPDQDYSTLNQIDQKLSDNLSAFLNESIVASTKRIQDIEQNFSAFKIPHSPEFISDHAEQLLDTLVADSVHTSSPYFIGHMTSALPYFHLVLAKLLVGLNQNVVKVETSKAFTPMERQVLGMMHHLVYKNDDDFYQRTLHNPNQALGIFCSGGTVANISALWVARNKAFAPQGDFAGLARKGVHAAMQHCGYQRMVVLTSERGHYSLSKAADILGIGRDNVISVAVDSQQRINLDALAQTCEQLTQENAKILAIVGIAGTTETGNIDPLQEIAAIAQQYQAHFHVDAAWGGATLLSDKYAQLMSGIELADSVTIDAHKQMYVPMGAGLVLFKDETATDAIRHHAEYIIRKGSRDLGSFSLEGSRGGMAMLLYSALNIIGREGYAMLIDQSIEKAQHFAKLIQQHANFELTSQPELCLLTYRYVPSELAKELTTASQQRRDEINQALNKLTVDIQKRQREQGHSFVSRTRLQLDGYTEKSVVFRVVIANPLTEKSMLEEILLHQVALAKALI